MTKVAGLIRIGPDTPIYRIFPVWGFEESLRLRRLRLVQPSVWEDPFEKLISNTFISDHTSSTAPYIGLAEHSMVLYGQCWSATSESDTLWRAYSRVAKDKHHKRNLHPGDEGVKVKTTPRKLLAALRASFPDDKTSFVGAVDYLPELDIHRRIGDRLMRDGIDAFMAPPALADFYLLKRDAFSHESEARLMLATEPSESASPTIEIPINPNDVFDEVQFDPRLEAFERQERETVAKTLGYSGVFPPSTLYVGLLLELTIKFS